MRLRPEGKSIRGSPNAPAPPPPASSSTRGRVRPRRRVPAACVNTGNAYAKQARACVNTGNARAERGRARMNARHGHGVLVRHAAMRTTENAFANATAYGKRIRGSAPRTTLAPVRVVRGDGRGHARGREAELGTQQRREAVVACASAPREFESRHVQILIRHITVPRARDAAHHSAPCA